MKLLGKVAIVTGSGRGIGKAIGLEFAKEGADVVVNAHKDVNAALKTSEEIRSLGRRSVPVIADVSKKQ